MSAPTQAQVDQALAQEWSLEPPTEAQRRWNVDPSLAFTIPGPVAVIVDSDPEGSDLDDFHYRVTLGPLQMRVTYDGAEAVMFALAEQLYGRDWTRLLMALCARLPVDFEDNDLSVPTGAAQALWVAAYSYREHWPQRITGFNDHVWGVPTPAGVEFQMTDGSEL